MATLAAWGIPRAGLNLVDGSGLDRGDRLTCQALLGLMERAGTAGPLAAALPVAARSGTLIPYFQGNPMAGRLHAKTGTLTGSKALTGYVAAPDGHTITFAFVYNGPDERAKASELFNQFGLALATYPYKPNLAAYSPVPARR
jgi:D-alanyl-D-alanine carboxypeptidase/D-alanyl-D-alanine-endopeptidase (penicillin-binding protein 4)